MNESNITESINKFLLENNYEVEMTKIHKFCRHQHSNVHIYAKKIEVRTKRDTILPK